MTPRAGAIAFLLVSSLPLCARTPAECREHLRYGRLDAARQCHTRLASSSHPFARAEALWALGRYVEANASFNMAVKAQPENLELRVRWGRLFLDRYVPAEAATIFKEALEIDPNYPPALLGMALVAAGSFESRAVELAEKALKGDPKLLEAQELLARLALEDSNPERAVKEAKKALELSEAALDAMAVLATIDWLDDKKETPWIDRILKINPVYGQAYGLAGRIFVLNRRYDEAIELFQKALALRPELDDIRSDLGVNLMRMGREKEAREHLERCYHNGYQSHQTVNSLRLLDSYANFETFRTPRTILKLHKKEAELLRPYFESELIRAIETFEKKYKVKLPGPVQLEVYPDHEDFAVRTMGMPGLGALGVTFGSVVAMDSPSGRKPGSFHWASTLWHELSHVFVLTATNHRVPRWFTEGLAVHEETATDPEWGDRLSADIIGAIKNKRLLPVSELDRGFVRPRFPAQVIVSYFQAGRICDYIAERWGYQTLLDMMHSFSKSASTPDVIQKHLGMEAEKFDEEFLAWLDGQVGTTVKGFEEWSKRLRAIAANVKKKEWDEVIREGLEIRDIYPEYVEAANVYEFLSEAYLAKGDKASAMTELERWAKAGGRNPETLKKLADMQEEAGKIREAAGTLHRINYIYPVQSEDVHRRLGDLWTKLGNMEGAVLEYRAVVASRPIDPAAAHFQLAGAYRQLNKMDEAQEHLFLALEAAPGYRPAQRMLLELNAESTKKD